MSRRADVPLLRVDGLRTHVDTDRGTVRAVDGVDFALDRGETVCLVGESGSGKSLLCQTLLRIAPEPPTRIVDGSVWLEETDLLSLDERSLRDIRGNRIAYVFQNPQRSLDPVYTVGSQIEETLQIHASTPSGTTRQRAIELLRDVGIPQAHQRIDQYPHEFSGGMQQRIAIAIALAAEPDLLIADEPTTSLDTTVQARLIERLRRLTDEGMALLLVTHDLRVAASLGDRLLMMYAGTIVERGRLEDVYNHRAHPYTQSLFASYRGSSASEVTHTPRHDIPTGGCRFRTECSHAIDACESDGQPAFERLSDGSQPHDVSCVYYGDGHDESKIASTAPTSTTPDAGERR